MIRRKLVLIDERREMRDVCDIAYFIVIHHLSSFIPRSQELYDYNEA